jgi:guanylate kinase
MSSTIFVITGTSGAGKDSVIEKLREMGLDFEQVVTTTTRKKREGEEQGKPYFFITENEFKELVSSGQMAEFAEVYGNFYGVTKNEIARCVETGKPVIWRIDVQGAISAKKQYPQNSKVIFIKTPDLQTLGNRLRSRGQNNEKDITERLRVAEQEIAIARSNSVFDHIINNEEGKLEETAQKVSQIIKENHGQIES